MTVGDKIRNMSDEELAEYLTKDGTFCQACSRLHSSKECLYVKCEEKVRLGLKQKWEGVK